MRRFAPLFIVLLTVLFAFDALQHLGSVAELRPFISWTAWEREAIALGYQIGSLLPTLVPVALWLASARELWAGTRQGVETAPMAASPELF